MVPEKQPPAPHCWAPFSLAPPQARRSVALHAAAPRDDRLSSVAVRQQLRKLIQSLDGVLPYLTLAISAVGLLSSAGGPRGLQWERFCRDSQALGGLLCIAVHPPQIQCFLLVRPAFTV